MKMLLSVLQDVKSNKQGICTYNKPPAVFHEKARHKPGPKQFFLFI